MAGIAKLFDSIRNEIQSKGGIKFLEGVVVAKLRQNLVALNHNGVDFLISILSQGHPCTVPDDFHPDKLENMLKNLGYETIEQLENDLNLLEKLHMNPGSMMRYIHPRPEIKTSGISRTNLKSILDVYRKHLMPSVTIQVRKDREYRLIAKEDVLELITLTGIHRQQYKPESHDCDDMAHMLKGRLTEMGYGDCFGLCEVHLKQGNVVKAHDMLFFVCRGTHKLYLINAGDYQIIEAGEKLTDRMNSYDCLIRWGYV